MEGRKSLKERLYGDVQLRDYCGGTACSHRSIQQKTLVRGGSSLSGGRPRFLSVSTRLALSECVVEECMMATPMDVPSAGQEREQHVVMGWRLERQLFSRRKTSDLSRISKASLIRSNGV